MAVNSVKMAGLEFKNPVLLASGILDETGASMAEVARLGAGGLVTKSVGIEPRTGHPNPTITETPCGLVNAMGLPNPGMDEYVHEISDALAGGVPIIASIYAPDIDGFMTLAEKARDAGASALELNLSCPHAKGLGLEMGQDPQMGRDVVKAAKTAGIPVFPKISPHVNDLEAMAKAFENGGADGITAVNTLRAMAIDIDSRMPVLGNRTGGLSGPALKPVGLRTVYELYRITTLPIIGVGGITSGRDAMEYIMAGATMVQVGTAAYYKGPGACGEIAQELESLMDAMGYARIEDAVGAANHRRP